MCIFTFKGGIHPKEMKDLSCEKQIKSVLPANKTVTIPATMGGAPNTILVKVGDLVSKGQKIADGEKFMNCPVHSSVSGKVKKIQNCVVTGNVEVPCIIIESDDENRTAFLEPLDPFTCDTKTAVARIKEAGIVGMGGASFPTFVKFTLSPDKKINYVLLNAAECEPYLTCDERTLQEETKKIIDGLSICTHITASKGIIALEDNKAYIKPILEKEIEEQNKQNNIEVRLVKTKYPQGSEKFIVSACTGLEIPSKKLPADVGCIIVNVGTAAAISDAFREGKPLIERSLTISGFGVKEPCNIRVPVGTLISDLIPSVFEYDEEKTLKILSGGPMMGFAMSSPAFPVAKGTSGVLFLTEKDISITEEDSCLNCGKCIDKCPMNLYPVLMKNCLDAENYDKSVKFGLMDCIECGSCAYVCPAHIKLVQRFRLGKNVVRAKMAEAKAKADAEAKKNENTSKEAAK